MKTTSRHTIRRAREHPRLFTVAAAAVSAGLLIGAATSDANAQSDPAQPSSTLQSYPASGTSGDRGVGNVYRQEQTVSPDSMQGVTSAPSPGSTGDRGVNQLQRLRGEEVYMGRLSARSGDEVRHSAGDRGVNQSYTLRSEQTTVDPEEMQAIIDDMQSMIDDAQASLDQHNEFYFGYYNAAAGTSGDRGIGRVYRPEASASYIPDYSGDTNRALPPRTSGDRGVGRVYRDDRVYRERAAQKRAGQRVDLYGLGGFTLPEEQVELDELQARLDALRTRINDGPRTSGDRGENLPLRDTTGRGPSESLRHYPASGTSGDRGMHRVWRDEVLAREASRIDHEQRMLDRGQRKLDRLQRKLDRHVERYARTTAGDRGVGVASSEQAPSVQRALEQLFSQLDRDDNQMLSAEEAKRLMIVRRNFQDLDNDEDGNITLTEFTDIIEESETL